MGGEEFLLVLVDTEPERAVGLAEDLRAGIAGAALGRADRRGAGHRQHRRGQHRRGTTCYAADLLGRADAHLYRPRSRGRNRVVTESA